MTTTSTKAKALIARKRKRYPALSHIQARDLVILDKKWELQDLGKSFPYGVQYLDKVSDLEGLMQELKKL